MGSDAPCQATSTTASRNSHLARSASHSGLKKLSFARLRGTDRTTSHVAASHPEAVARVESENDPLATFEDPEGNTPSAARKRAPKGFGAAERLSRRSSPPGTRAPTPGRRASQYSSATSRLAASSPPGCPSTTARSSGALTAGRSASDGAAFASAAQNATCASRVAPSSAFHRLRSARIAARRHASRSIFLPRGHRACSAATPGSASASARMASACTCASRVERSASRPSTLLVNARSANAAPRAASAAATRASA